MLSAVSNAILLIVDSALNSYSTLSMVSTIVVIVELLLPNSMHMLTHTHKLAHTVSESHYTTYKLNLVLHYIELSHV